MSAPSSGGGVEQRRHQGLGPLGPVGSVAVGRVPARGDDPTSTSDRAMVRAGSQSCTTAGATSATGGAGARSAPPIRSGSNRKHRRAGPGVDGGIEDVRFGRRGDHRTVARQHVGNDQRRRLPRARWTEDHHRLLGSDEAPTVLAVPQIHAVPGVGGRVQYAAKLRRNGVVGALSGKIFSSCRTSRHRARATLRVKADDDLPRLQRLASLCRIILANKRFSVHDSLPIGHATSRRSGAPIADGDDARVRPRLAASVRDGA